MSTQSRIEPASVPWREQLSGKVCPACAAHYGGDLCPYCSFIQRFERRIKQLREELSTR